MSKLLILNIFSLFSLPALAFGEFKGCGEYYFAGKLIKNTKNELVYVIKEKTKSQLTFSISDDDRTTILGHLDKPTSFIGTIPKPMDGTKGIIKNITEVSIRMPDPLSSTQDSYIEFKTKKDCEK